jgi:hypothetical protein
VKTLIIALVALSFQGAFRIEVGNLVGKWISSTVPPAGEAPTIAPSFTVEMKDNRVLVTMEGMKEPQTATVFQASLKESLLVIRTSGPQSSTQTLIIRSVAGGQVRLEMFTEYPGERARSNFYHSEAFKRASQF